MSTCTPVSSGATRLLVIAEAGVNHCGDPRRALDMVEVAAEAGADVIKFQTFKAEKVVGVLAPKAAYQVRSTGAEESQLEMVRKLELSPETHRELVLACQRRGIEFLSTAFDEDSLELLLRLGVRRIKVPSGELTNVPLLRKLGACRLPVILSTGMADLEEVAFAVQVLTEAGSEKTDLTVLHCVTEYPTPPEQVNLLAMLTLGERFGTPVGFSDHTLGWDVTTAAVALGATVIEKHFTLDRSLPGPDHQAALEPRELKAMVKALRTVEAALGDGEKRPAACERSNRTIARRSIVAARDIAAGEVFDASNLTTLRPATGTSARHWDKVLGLIAAREYRRGDILDLQFPEETT